MKRTFWKAILALLACGALIGAAACDGSADNLPVPETPAPEVPAPETPAPETPSDPEDPTPETPSEPENPVPDEPVEPNEPEEETGGGIELPEDKFD